MQMAISNDFKTGIFIKELKNRFLCEVEIDSKPVVCYGHPLVILAIF